jgi:thiamine pyrophosphokinase
MVIAADRGADNAIALGLTVDLLVGDLDSVSQETLAACNTVAQHPVDKDATDLELALAAAVDTGAGAVTVVTSAGGRFDHALANLLVAASDRWSALKVDLVVDGARVHVVRDKVVLEGPVGGPVSLLAVGGPVSGVSTTGLRWPLRGAPLEAGFGLGVSNEFAQPEASVTVGTGVVFVILPSPEQP